MPRRAVWLALGGVALVAAVARSPGVVVDRGEDRQAAPDRPALSSAEYRSELNAVVKHAPLVGSPADVAGLRKWAAEFHRFADDLADIAPPRDAADMHRRVIEGLNGHADLIERYADSGAAGLATYQEHLASGIGASELQWTGAFNELIARGYVTYRLD